MEPNHDDSSEAHHTEGHGGDQEAERDVGVDCVPRVDEKLRQLHAHGFLGGDPACSIETYLGHEVVVNGGCTRRKDDHIGWMGRPGCECQP